MNKKELERQKQNLIARGVGYILGYLFAILLWGIVISVITVGIIAGFTWVIFSVRALRSYSESSYWQFF